MPLANTIYPSIALHPFLATALAIWLAAGDALVGVDRIVAAPLGTLGPVTYLAMSFYEDSTLVSPWD
jgi:hypothetical protein